MKVSGLILPIAVAGRPVLAQFNTLGLDTLDLLDYSGLQSSNVGHLTSDNGVDYNISDLQPYAGIFAEDSFVISEDKLTATHKHTGEQFDVSTFRASYNDGTMFQASIDVDGKMSYAEIRERVGALDTFFISSGMKTVALVDSAEGSDEEVMLAFNSSSLDEAKLSQDVDLGDAPPITGDNRNLREAFSLSQFRDTQRRTQSASCSSLRVVKVAVAYDAELCGFYGGRTRTVNRLLTIVSSASAIYERDLCIKLELSDIFSPDKTCGGTSSTFNSFAYENACDGFGSLLGDFTAWTRTARNALGLDSNALIHYFTGVTRPTTTRVVGCAWLGVYCIPRWATGIEYMTFSNNIVTQTIVYAHELGHNLNAPHLPDPQNRFNYVMEASLTSGSDGFSDESGRQIFSYLNSRDVTCDVSVPANPDRRPAPAPTPAPVRRTRAPVPAPTPAPIRRTLQPVPAPTPAPVRRTRQPVLPPTRQPIPQPSPVASPITRQCPKDDNPICIAESDKSDRFACFRYDAITPPDCNGIRYELSKCNDMTVRRVLKEEGCMASCILLKNFICLNGSADEHELEFEGFDARDRATGDTFVKQIPVSNGKQCIAASAKCNA